jgi:biotin-[acetyl-CoA-carboxylase] ligase BirA-like protein
MEHLVYDVHLPVVSSTNDYAKELLERHPLVCVTAQHQTAGRGRNGNRWEGDFGSNVYLSIGINHVTMAGAPLAHQPLLYMALGALSVVRAIEQIAPAVLLRLKYPNDVQAVYNGVWSKIAGVLVENEYMGMDCVSSVVGIGTNVQQQQFSNTIEQPCTSLHLLGVNTTSTIVAQTIRRFALEFLEYDDVALQQLWQQHLGATQRVLVHGDDDVYVIYGVRSDGQLVLQHSTTDKQKVVSDGNTLRYLD